jgi:hypothetical protein
MRTVNHGVALLDRAVEEDEGGDWASRIDLEHLVLFTETSCVLGQLHGSYDRGKRRLGLSNNIVAARYGFFCASSRRYRRTEKAWRKVIAARQSSLA